MDYISFFEKITGQTPYPYQHALARAPWPELIDIPTGLGKTAAVGLAWLYRRAQHDPHTPRRLVWCLPMRSLVEQTYENFQHWVEASAELFDIPTSINILMGGSQHIDWAAHPERDAVVIGTQDMLISRALMRGYGMSRYAWPLHYAWLHNDALWVFDETQLMGPTVPTSAQLQALRRKLGTAEPTHSIWMSATLNNAPLETVDHPYPDEGWQPHRLSALDMIEPDVLKRVAARKSLHRCDTFFDKDSIKTGKGLDTLADAIVDAHTDDDLTLVVVNRVTRAQELFKRVTERAGDTPVALLHSRFRPADRHKHAQMLEAEGGRIIIATQVVEAGIDISARTLFTELAPWPSLVQRFGRCNRYGEFDDAKVFWIDLAPKNEKDGEVLLPYTLEELNLARASLQSLEDVGPRALQAINYQSSDPFFPVLRRRDLLELFDTTPDLSGNDLDVSRYIRDSDDTDLSFYWRTFDGTPTANAIQAPDANELCRVSIGQARTFLNKKDVEAWRFDPLEKRWQKLTKQSGPRPGELLLIESSTGGYDEELGFIGAMRKRQPTPPVELSNLSELESMSDDPRTFINQWLSLEDHTNNVVREVEKLSDALGLDEQICALLKSAARWHDLGKAHPVFQKRLLTPAPNTDAPPADPDTIWAKSDHRRGTISRPGFRHELASALAWLQLSPDDATNPRERFLVAYLIAAHHGKVRLSIRSLPDEKRPSDNRLFARGVWQGDTLLSVNLGGGVVTEEIELDLKPMRLGKGSWLEGCLELRDAHDLGPFRLAMLESILRLADQRASALEQKRAALNKQIENATQPQEVS